MYEEGERKEGADDATGRLDNVDWCNHARAVSDYAGCQCMSELPSAPPATIVVDDRPVKRNHGI